MSPIRKSLREEVLERDGYECRFCGITEDEHKEKYNKSLSLHHIIKERDGGKTEADNLITVCKKCHMTLENTQADALSKIKKEEHGYQDLIDKIENLEDEVDYLKEEDDISRSAWAALEKATTQYGNITVYIVHETKITTSELRYVGRNKENAVESFENAKNHATLETATIGSIMPLELIDIEKIDNDVAADGLKDEKISNGLEE